MIKFLALVEEYDISSHSLESHFISTINNTTSLWISVTVATLLYCFCANLCIHQTISRDFLKIYLSQLTYLNGPVFVREESYRTKRTIFLGVRGSVFFLLQQPSKQSHVLN